MSLLKKALIYREKFLNEHIIGYSIGLFKRVLSFLYPKKHVNQIKKTPVKKKIEEIEAIEKANIKSTETFNEIKDDSKKTVSQYYKNIMQNIADDLSRLKLENNAYIKFNDIMTKYFKFQKNALLIYLPDKQKFTCWCGVNIDNDTTTKLSFDLEYKNIYKNIVKKNSYIVYSKDKEFLELKELLSSKDFNDTDFQLFIPFVFSGHVIGIFLGLKMKNEEIPDKELINSMEIIGKLNGALIYNIFQQTDRARLQQV